ncbi:unnamed protein product [Thlaspi arvense]|uniref:Protein kinase domain-containing protein n=1 Tax=Thlaspi arvense TaxID=13288 RepID=A0AAU9RSJ9_THLAR|nr:unnamed protein product [Thlaspi arvense]
MCQLAGCANDLSLKGSPHWMAPEAVMRKDSNPRLACAVDIWSLGCTVIEMLTGRPPWNELNGNEGLFEITKLDGTIMSQSRQVRPSGKLNLDDLDNLSSGSSQWLCSQREEQEKVQAMFNVLHKLPPIPETLSLEGKDFLRQCFQRIPADRPSAELLLEHPFLRASHELDFPICIREMKLNDTPHTPRRDRRQNMGGSNSVPVSPRARIRQLPYNGWLRVSSTSLGGLLSRDLCKQLNTIAGAAWETILTDYRNHADSSTPSYTHRNPIQLNFCLISSPFFSCLV